MNAPAPHSARPTRRHWLAGGLSGLASWSGWGGLLSGPAQAAADAPRAPGGTVRPQVLDTPALRSPKALQATLLALARAGGRLVAVGERGTVLLSDDGGRQWRQSAQVPVQVTLTGVRFLDARLGWAVGHQGVILRSDDGGERWHRQLDGVQAAAACAALAPQLGDEHSARQLQRLGEEGPDKPFFDLLFSDERTGWAVGAYGLAFATQDGGAHWHPISHRLDNPRSLHLYALARLTPGSASPPDATGRDTLLVAGEQGLILRGPAPQASERHAAQASPAEAAPAPRRLDRQPSGYKGSLFGLLATPGGALLAYGLRGSLLRSEDGGQRWQAQPAQTGGASLSAAGVLPDSRVALIAHSGQLLLSADDGRSFQPQPPPSGTPPVAALAVADARTLVLAGPRGPRLQPLA